MNKRNLFSLTPDGRQVRIAEPVDSAEAQRRKQTANELLDYVERERAKLPCLARRQAPYFANVSKRDVAHHAGTLCAIGRMVEILAAHPDLQSNFGMTLLRVVDVADRVAMKCPGVNPPYRTLDMAVAAIRAIGKELDIVLPTYVM